MFTAEQIADHPFPDILIGNNEAEVKVAAEAAEAADITSRSCYRLRRHPQVTAFAKAWPNGLQLSADAPRRSLDAAGSLWRPAA